MNEKPIQTEAEYRQALAEIDEIFDAPPGTREWNRLNSLSALVESYECEYFPIEPPDPVEPIL